MTRQLSINKPPRGQRGVVLIWFALFLPVLIGFIALAVDVSRLYLIRVELQNAADAAALAGTYKYADGADSTAAKIKAENLATRNYANGALINATSVTATVADATPYTYAIRVKITLPGINLFFAPILGIASQAVSATAIAAANAVAHPAAPTPILVK